MTQHIRANLYLLVLTLLLCCVLYPACLWGIGQAVFHEQAEGSLLNGTDGTVIGSRLIAQPFQDKDGNALDEYFQPRPSAASYKADSSGASNWAASNYLLRDRVARAIGPIVKYGPTSGKLGQLVGPDIEGWFQKDQFGGKPGIVSQWAQAHPTLAKNWVKGDKINTAHVEKWSQTHQAAIDAWIRENTGKGKPKPEDLAVAFFEDFAKLNPGQFPGQTEHKLPSGQVEKEITPVKEGSDIQSYFFDMWRQEHPQVDLEEVPADMVMASGSGLDPHITLDNARYQLDRVARTWAEKSHGDKEQVRKQIETMLEEKAEAPFAGVIGVKLINVLEMNLALKAQFGGNKG
jgi:K+-transporting ATPase ATPase C chain